MLRIVSDQEAESAAAAQELATPPFTWAELEEALTAIAASPRQRSMTPALVSAIRSRASGLPRSQALREILSLAWVIADETLTEAEAG